MAYNSHASTGADKAVKLSAPDHVVVRDYIVQDMIIDVVEDS